MTDRATDVSRPNLVPLDLGPAAALRSYAKLTLVAVIIPALAVGLLAALYAAATRAPAVLLIAVSVGTIAILLKIAAHGLSSIPMQPSGQRAQNPAGATPHVGPYAEFLQRMRSSAADLQFRPERSAADMFNIELVTPTNEPKPWWATSETGAKERAREIRETLLESLIHQGDLLTGHSSGHEGEIAKSWFLRQIELGSFPAESMQALGVIALQTGDVHEAQEWFLRYAEVARSRTSTTGTSGT